jgi:large subunit ribosomal protein L6
MSNLGIKEIKIPFNIKVTIKNNLLHMKSDFGCLIYVIKSNFILEITKKKTIVLFPITKYFKNTSCNWGTQYSLLKNNINGLSKGYTKTLKLIGVGFRVNLDNNKLTFKLGYSHKINYIIPFDIIIKCPKQDEIIIFGLDKQKVNEIIKKIQLLKKIDVYKGKGIILENTKIKLKEGKKK